MISREDIGFDKLRGGFYTPAPLADFCIRRVLELKNGRCLRHWLEPSSGDGTFVRQLANRPECARELDSLTCVELVPAEAEKTAGAMRRCGIPGRVVNASFFRWAFDSEPTHTFDALVGNPPFVRYQFFDPGDRACAEWLAAAAGMRMRRVSNMWIPFAVVGISLLKVGGAFSLILPAELFTTVSAGDFREWLLESASNVRIDLFPKSAFPGILQDVVILSGRRSERSRRKKTLRFNSHGSSPRRWKHRVVPGPESWTRYRLSAEQLDAFIHAEESEDIHRLGALAKMSVATVTGANKFFTATDDVLEANELERWARPLLPKTAAFDGLVFRDTDHDSLTDPTVPRWLLEFGEHYPDPMNSSAPRAYLTSETALDLSKRYKCRIRTPWYRVPIVSPGRLMMTKRAHFHHRLLLNEAGVVTTDTIYQGKERGLAVGRGRDLVAGFHNSITLLSSEIEGRSYGGGVLELVPSEIARLAVPLLPLGRELGRLDTTSRQTGGQKDQDFNLVEATNASIGSVAPHLRESLNTCIEAWADLRSLRLGR